MLKYYTILAGLLVLTSCANQQIQTAPAPVQIDQQALDRKIEHTYLYGDFKILATSKNNHKLITSAKTVRPNLSGGFGLSPLMAIIGNEVASNKQIYTVAKILIYRGADVNAYTQYGISPLLLVLHLNKRPKLQYSLLKLLLQHRLQVKHLSKQTEQEIAKMNPKIQQLLAKYQGKIKK